MNLKTTINGISEHIEKSSIITWINWSGKSSILNSVEIGIWWTLYWVRPKVKWTVEFESKYKAKASKLPIQDLVYARFLQLEPIKRKKILLQLIDSKPIKDKLWKYWGWNIEDSIESINAKYKITCKALKSAESEIDFFSKEKADKEEKLGTYADKYDTDFDFIDVKPVVNNINRCKNSLNETVKEWKELSKENCSLCGHKLKKDKMDEKHKEKLKAKYLLIQKELLGYEKELKDAESNNKLWEKVAENIKLQTEKNNLINEIAKMEERIEQSIANLSELQSDNIGELREYCKKEIYTEINKQLNLWDFELDLSVWFKLKYNWKPYEEMSRGQKYVADIRFSKMILEMQGIKLMCLDDFEMVDLTTREEIITDLEWFDYLIAVVKDCKLTY